MKEDSFKLKLNLKSAIMMMVANMVIGAIVLFLLMGALRLFASPAYDMVFSIGSYSAIVVFAIFNSALTALLIQYLTLRHVFEKIDEILLEVERESEKEVKDLVEKAIKRRDESWQRLWVEHLTAIRQDCLGEVDKLFPTGINPDKIVLMCNIEKIFSKPSKAKQHGQGETVPNV